MTTEFSPFNIPKESFKISGISFYQNYIIGITYDTELKMELEPENAYDSTAIRIVFNGNTIGYVPNANDRIKQLCTNNINEPLKIINISKIKDITGIRVIPKCFV